MKKPRCVKCGKTIYKKQGMHLTVSRHSLPLKLWKVETIDGGSAYHWDCFDPEYNKKIEALLKDAHNETT